MLSHADTLIFDNPVLFCSVNFDHSEIKYLDRKLSKKYSALLDYWAEQEGFDYLFADDLLIIENPLVNNEYFLFEFRRVANRNEVYTLPLIRSIELRQDLDGLEKIINRLSEGYYD